jgi:transketolase
VDVGIAEQTLVGAAAGLALRGRIPVAHGLASFLTMRAFEFIRTDVGVGNLPVKLVGSVAGILSEANGPTHQALEDVALMRLVPNMGVFCPADEEDLLLGLEAVLTAPQPFYVRLNLLPPAVPHDRRFALGRAELVLDGSDVAILTYGTLFGEVLRAARLLESSGLSVWLVNLRTLKPIDEGAVLEAASATRLLVTVEDHFASGGLASAVAEVLAAHRSAIRMFSISFRDRWFAPALYDEVLETEGLTGPQIADRIQAAFSSREE